jgi:hypothetical protein
MPILLKSHSYGRRNETCEACDNQQLPGALSITLRGEGVKIRAVSDEILSLQTHPGSLTLAFSPSSSWKGTRGRTCRSEASGRLPIAHLLHVV